MALTTRPHMTNAQGELVDLIGSFRIDGTNSPDVVRDGRSDTMTVERLSPGLFEVTIADGILIPELLITWRVDLARVAAPATSCEAHYVVDSYSEVDRTFQIAVTGPTDAAGSDSDATPAAADPSDNDMIAFTLTGSISSAGTDLA